MAGLSKLRAVNMALENISESPVNTLVGATGDAYVSTAKSIVEEIARVVCGEIWNFNMDKDYSITPDINGNVIITDNMISVDGTYTTDDYAVRQGKLYNKEDQTFVFTDTVHVDIVWEFEFEDIPQHVRDYLALKAARTFARRMLGDANNDNLTAEDESRARAIAKRHDARNRDRTIFQDATSGLHRLKNRRLIRGASF
jgi:hypothetical protein